MTIGKRDFEELTAPASAAKQLGISAATLRKYSLIVEQVTGNPDYFERTKQKARLYHQKDLEDLDALHKLDKEKGKTLKEAARQIYAVSESKPDEVEDSTENQALMDTAQVVKLLGALQQTIASQNQAIKRLQEQLARVEKQNQTLLDNQKQLAAPKDQEVDPAIAALPDISGIVVNNGPTRSESMAEETAKTPEQKRQEVAADRNKSQQEVHDEILNKAKENAKKRASANVHRTLEDMQLRDQKKHWWQKFLNL